MGGRPGELESPIYVRPVCVTYWDGANSGAWESVDPGDTDRLRPLADVIAGGGTAWIEARLDGLSKEQCTWLEGEYDIWAALPTPVMDWSPMRTTLDAVGLEPPTPHRKEGEPGVQRLLRALPYAYTRGAFGTVRDALSEDRAVLELVRAVRGGPLTTFPTAGFVPGKGGAHGGTARYTVLHATIGVLGGVVVSIRLPDAFCPPGTDDRGHTSPEMLVPVDVLTRFLPLRRMATGREVAEAIGMHQATSARAVASEIRERLKETERVAGSLNADDTSSGRNPKLKAEVMKAVETIDGLTEVANQLDRNLSTILRRFSGEIPDAAEATRQLVPPEVERRYRFALDNVHALREDCRLAAQVARQALAVYEQAQREHFQFIAALLASIILIPTLVAGVFGANLNIPARKDPQGFLYFLLVIIALAGIGLFVMRSAKKHHWAPPKENFILPAILAVIVLALFTAFLVTADSDSEEKDERPGQRQAIRDSRRK